MLNEEELRDASLLVFANKQDQPGAKNAGEISEALRLGELRDRNWSIVACSAIDGKGIDEGMDWLVVCISFLRLGGESSYFPPPLFHPKAAICLAEQEQETNLLRNQQTLQSENAA